jgi:uncharacterized membrane protein
MLAAALTILAALWTLVILFTPIAAARGQLPWAVLFAYQLGAMICHQRPERSFHLAGIQMPVCARCFGLYAAGTAGLLIAWAIGRGLPLRRSRAVLIAAALPIALSIALEWAGAIATTNLFRTMTALPLGLAAGFIAVASLRRVSPASRQLI